ncbi:MAG TPA: lytic transglycosylase domain-containing protein [Chitinophagaceae bacterium]|nr:lytic transglycosylase domain-containing protein [Chitinophagaceae bacterium]
MRFLLTILISIFCIGATAQQADSIRDLSKSRLYKPVDSTVAPVNVTNDPKEGFKDLFVGDPEEEGLNQVQLNPRAVTFVDDYMQKHRKGLEKLKGWGRPYFDMIDAVLNYHSLPRELKYLAVIESYLKTYAVSWAGAVGPWQFMPATARRMGLKVNGYVDERTDYYKSTHAAAKYLNELYRNYKDWLLVIAAYNGGPRNVDAAIRRSKSKNFWDLQHFLPAESRDHVKKFIATHYIMEGDGGITTLTKDETEILRQASNVNPAAKNLTIAEMTNSKVQAISGRYNSLVIAKHITFSITEFNRYNPDFDKLITHNGKYELRLPADKMDLFIAKRYDILNESLQIMLDSFKQSLSTPAKKPPLKKSSG